jgi:hypothetical protein
MWLALPFVIAIGSVGTFYAHTFLGRPPEELTPAITIGVAMSLAASAACGILSLRTIGFVSTARKISVAALAVSVLFEFTSSVRGILLGTMSRPDWGIFVIQVLSPVLILLSTQRPIILKAILNTAVVFAFGDFLVNFATYTGAAALSEISGGDRTSYGIHYLGLPGNTFAEGIVGFLAICYLSSGIPLSKTRKEFVFRLALVIILFCSELLIRARTDLALSILAFILLSFPKSSKLSPIILSIMLSAVLLYGIKYYNPYHTDERLRTSLMSRGLVQLKDNILLGQGAHYKSTADLTGNFQILSSAGITESGSIDFGIAYGVVALIFLYVSIFFGLGAKRDYQTLPAVLLTCLSASLVINGGLTSFLGSITLYLSLVMCQEERRA